MSDENDKLFTIELTEDEIDQCTHAINELCEVFVKDGHSLKELEIQSYLNTARKLESVFTRPVVDALSENLVALEEENIRTIQEWDEKNSATACRYINHIDCFIQSEQGDFEGFIKMKRWFLERTPKHELEKFIEDTIDIAEYIDTQVSSLKLEAFCKELELLKPSNTDRFAMGTPSVAHAGENKEGDL